MVPYLVPPEDLSKLLPDQPSYRANQLRHWLYRQPVLRADSMTNLPLEVRHLIGERLWPFEIEAEQTADHGATKKWLFRASDGAALEAVLMAYPAKSRPPRATLCVSSQAGCALGCTFCATGQFGFDRHLAAGEIVGQVAYAQAFLRQVGLPGAPLHLTNLVFMGMGEPLANYDRVREALRRIIDVMGMSARAITVSTVGMVPGIRRLAEEPWPLNLAVSLHAADDQLRSRLVPLNKLYPLADVEAAAARYFALKHRRISIEWTMIDGVNDNPTQAAGLADIARRLRATST
jgi:23S rRNA (adenine2503-C2)-methyltransferase